MDEIVLRVDQQMVLENKLKPSDCNCTEDTPLNQHSNCTSTCSVKSNGATAIIVQKTDGDNWQNDQSDIGSWYSVNTSASSSETASNKMGSTEYIKMDNGSEVHYNENNESNLSFQYFDDVENHRSNGLVRINMPTPSREEPKYPPEKLKTLFSLLFYWAAAALNMASLAIVHERLPSREKYPPLRDVVFDLVPPSDWALSVSEIIIMIAVFSCLLILFLHKHKFIIFRRIFFILGILYLMRAVTIFVTILPVASTTYYCSPKANSTNALLVLKRTFKLMSGFGLSINNQHVYCGDYLYSGHTVILTLSYLVVKEYTPRRCFILHWLSWCLSLCGIIMVIISRGHYTIDVLIAYYATTRIFWIYHTIACNPALKVSNSNNFLSRLWWFRILRYMEGKVLGVVPRQFEWPFPWPRCMRRRSLSAS